MAPPNSGTAQHPIQDSSTKVLDRYLLTDCSYLLTDCFPHFSHFPHSSKLFPTSSPAHMVLSPCQTLPSPGLAHPFSSTHGIWNVHLFKPSSCSVTASFSFLQSTYPTWDYLFVCLFNVSSSNQHLRSILSFGSLANTQPAKISAWLMNRCSVTCYWMAAEMPVTCWRITGPLRCATQGLLALIAFCICSALFTFEEKRIQITIMKMDTQRNVLNLNTCM